jgi:hypothetical protein
VKASPSDDDRPIDCAPRVGGKRRIEALKTIRIAVLRSDIPMTFIVKCSLAETVPDE